MGWGTTPVQIQSFLYVSGNNSVTYNIGAGTGNANVGQSGAGLLYWGGGICSIGVVAFVILGWWYLQYCGGGICYIGVVARAGGGGQDIEVQREQTWAVVE